MKLSDLGEVGLIDLIREWTTSRKPVLVGIGDDAAVLEIGGDKDLVISTDVSVENVHFRTDVQPADEIGHRAMTGALSDLAAMGSTGIAAFVALHAPPDTEVDFIRELYRGMERVARPFGVQVAGGDTVSGPLALDITVVGSVPRGRAVLRSGASEGDRLFVSGELGRSEAGRRLRSGETASGVPARFRSTAESGHRAPQPRFDVAELLMRLPRRPTAMIDVSDGLAIDLRRLCEASDVGCSVDAETVPVDDAARFIAEAEGRDPWTLALEGGEDWELLFAIGADGVRDLEEAARRAGLAVSAVGRIVPRRDGMTLTREDGSRRELPRSGWDHFARRA
jgi:thiamine-monophosphate kinase